jgi:DNA-binding NtrC family response regulator
MTQPSSSPIEPGETTSSHIPGFQAFVGESPPMKRLYQLLSRVGPSTAPVLLVGESGTGKELAAHTLHRLSGRGGPFIAINCAAIPETLVEAELFGHEKGAFTGATSRQRGCFELAHDGTLFLDELAAMPLSTQATLLRALEEKSFRRLRGSKEVRVDVRIVVATNDVPGEAVREGRLREDLLYRINVFTIAIPRLRERLSDVPHLARHFIEELARLNGKSPMTLDPAAEELLLRYDWPGNVRELRNVIERAVVLTNDSVIHAHHLPDSVSSETGRSMSEVWESDEPLASGEERRSTNDEVSLRVGMSLEEATRSLMLRTLESTNFNKTRTAEILGVSAKTVYNKLKEWSPGGDAQPDRGNAVCLQRHNSESRSNTAQLVSIDDARQRRLG